MKNKTCGECKHFDTQKDKCLYNGRFYMSKSYFDACIDFEQKTITNGDKIRQMSNKEMAKFFGCLRHLEMCPHAHSDYPCEMCNLDYLNAPAESEGEDDTARN